MAEISIIVPTLNEALNIDQLLERTISVSATLMEYSFEIILVDDNSTDGTREKVSRWLSDPRIKLIHRCDEKGLASAIFAGAKAAKSEVLVIMDADLSHPPETIPELVEPIIADEKDMVIGSRYSAGGATSEWPLSRKIASKLATLAARVLTDIHDPLSGYFAIQKQQLLSLGRDVPGFKIGLEVIVKGGESLRVAEIPITFQDRKRGGSKFNLPIIMAYGRHIASLAGGNINMGTGMRFGLIGCLGFIIDYAIFHTLCQAGIGLGQATLLVSLWPPCLITC